MKIVVVGVGNLLLKDDGFGIHVIEMLKGMEEFREAGGGRGVEVVDAMTNTAMLLAAMDGKDKAVIVDAFSMGGEPGDIHVFRFNPHVDEFPSDIMLSIHDMHFKDAINTARGVYELPEEIVIVGAEPKEIDVGMELSQECRNAIPEVIKIIKKECGLD
jgi:hydrogenase maturation protease